MGLVAKSFRSASSPFYSARLLDCYLSGLVWFKNRRTAHYKDIDLSRRGLVPAFAVAPIWGDSQDRFTGLPVPPGLVTSWELAAVAHEERNGKRIPRVREKIGKRRGLVGIAQDLDRWILMYSNPDDADLFVLVHSPLTANIEQLPTQTKVTEVEIYREVRPFVTLGQMGVKPPVHSFYCNELYVWPTIVTLKKERTAYGLRFDIPRTLLSDKGIPLETEFHPSAEMTPFPDISRMRSFFSLLHDEDQLLIYIRHRPNYDRDDTRAEFVESLPGCKWKNWPKQWNLADLGRYRTPDFWLSDK